MAEEEVKNPEETAAENPAPADQVPPESPETEGSPAPENSQEESKSPEEPSEEEKAREKEEKKKERKKKRSKLLIRFLQLLVLVVLLSEAFLWVLFYVLMEKERQAESQQTEAPRRQVTDSAYANWGGVYRPIDWPEAEDSFASIPDYLQAQTGDTQDDPSANDGSGQ